MSVIKKGLEEAMKGGKGSRFFTLQTDVPVDVVLAHGVDGIQSVEQHDFWDYNPAPHLVCLGEDCPSCALGNEAKVKSYLAIITKEQEVKYFPIAVSIVQQLEKNEKAVGDLTGRVFRFEKTGTGLKTRYSTVSIGRKLDVSKFIIPDLEELLGPMTVDEQVARLNEAGVDTSSLKATTSKKSKVKKTDKPIKTEEGKAPWDDAPEEVEGAEGWATL
jgi:hypothetical protein